MAPQVPDSGVGDASLPPNEDFHPNPHHHKLKPRELKINIGEIITDLRNLDWSKVVWRNVLLFIVLHSYSVYGIYLLLFYAQWKTIVFSYVIAYFTALGITMGAHRLWAHRSYKARLPLRIFLTICQTMAFQNDIYEWSRDHRGHHKYSETDADPHNALRGFFFSHMGWLMCRKHPQVIEKGKGLDLSDLENDSVVMFQRKYYLPLVLLFCFVVPTVIPWWYWNEHAVTALMVVGFLRYNFTLHSTWLVNSLAHWVGSKPFDKFIYSSENSVVAYLTLGEGWHNYHHTFPWDYRTAEFGSITNFNFTCLIIDFCEKIGLAYDLKKASPEMIERRANRTGDMSYVPHASKTK